MGGQSPAGRFTTRSWRLLPAPTSPDLSPELRECAFGQRRAPTCAILAVGVNVPDQEEPIVRSHLELEERVRQRAHDIWKSHGDTGEDTALDDWLQAEREILGQSEGQSVQDRATVVGDARRPSRVFGERDAQESY